MYNLTGYENNIHMKKNINRKFSLNNLKKQDKIIPEYQMRDTVYEIGSQGKKRLSENAYAVIKEREYMEENKL